MYIYVSNTVNIYIYTYIHTYTYIYMSDKSPRSQVLGCLLLLLLPPPPPPPPPLQQRRVQARGRGRRLYTTTSDSRRGWSSGVSICTFVPVKQVLLY